MVAIVLLKTQSEVRTGVEGPTIRVQVHSQPSHGVARDRRARPLEAVARDKHVPDQGLNGRLPHQPDEEELLDDGGRDCAEGGEAEEQLAEPGRLVGVLGPAVLLQRALRLLLQLLYHRR